MRTTLGSNPKLELEHEIAGALSPPCRMHCPRRYHHPACEFGLFAAFIGFYGRGCSSTEKEKLSAWLDVRRGAIMQFAKRVDEGENFFPFDGKIIMAELTSMDEMIYKTA